MADERPPFVDKKVNQSNQSLIERWREKIQYPETGNYPGLISFRPYAANIYDLPVTAPKVDKPCTVHFILKVTDSGTPQLTRYKRVIVHILPN